MQQFGQHKRIYDDNLWMTFLSNKQTVFGFQIVGSTKEGIWKRHFRLSEIVILMTFLTLYRLKCRQHGAWAYESPTRHLKPRLSSNTWNRLSVSHTYTLLDRCIKQVVLHVSFSERLMTPGLIYQWIIEVISRWTMYTHTHAGLPRLFLFLFVCVCSAENNNLALWISFTCNSLWQ